MTAVNPSHKYSHSQTVATWASFPLDVVVLCILEAYQECIQPHNEYGYSWSI